MTVEQIIRELATNKEVIITLSETDQNDASERRGKLVITGPERLLMSLENAIWWAEDVDELGPETVEK